MRAMILAGGLGTRLRPLTRVRPKTLVPVMGTTVFHFWLSRLAALGFEKVVINAFHLPEQLVVAAQAKGLPLPVEVRVERQLLGTAGGIRNVLDFFEDQHFVVINGDVLCSAPLRELYAQHLNSGAAATLLMHHWPAFNHVAVDAGGWVRGFGDAAVALSRSDPGIGLLAFTGIHFLHPSVLRSLPPGEPADILTVYRQLIQDGNPPRAIITPDGFWREMGSIEAYWALNRELPNLPRAFLPPLLTGCSVWRHPQAHLAADVRTNGLVALGAGSQIKPGVILEDVIIWDGAIVEERSELRQCIVTDGVRCQGQHENEILLG
jgi:mannose-1-phosphate guanylyltransferase